MLRVAPLHQPSSGESPSRLIPRAVWRKLLLSPPVPTSSRVLFGGAHPGADARTLAALPVDLCVICTDERDVMPLRREIPQVDVYAVSQVATAIEPRSVDLIVLDHGAEFVANLFEAGVRQQTALWLSLLKPQGRLVFLQREEVASGHRAECWVRHLACFPGRIEQRETWDSLFDWSRWELFGPREHRPTTQLVSLTVPNEALSPQDWRDYARHGLLTSQRTCCVHASTASQPITLRRVA